MVIRQKLAVFAVFNVAKKVFYVALKTLAIVV